MQLSTQIKKLALAFPFKNSSIYLLNEVFQKGINLAYIPLLTHYLLPSQFGILSTLTSAVSFLIFCVGLNLNNYVSVAYLKSQNEENNHPLARYFSSFLSILIASTIGLLLVACFNIGFIKNIFQSTSNICLVIGIAFFETLVSYKINDSVVRSKPQLVLRLTVLKSSIDFLVTFLLIAFFNWSYVARLVGLLVSGIFCLIFYKNEFKHLNTQFVGNIKTGLQFIKSAALLIPHEMSLWFRGGMDRFLILSIVGASFSGIYSLSFQLALIMAVVAGAVNNALIPRIYKYEGNKPFAENYFSYLKTYSIIVAALFVGMFFIFPFILTKIISTKYEGFIFYYRILLVGFFFKSFYFYFVNIILFKGQSVDLSKISVTVSIIHFTLMLSLLKYTGLTGATIIFCSSEFLLLLIVILRGLHVLKNMQVVVE
jgi:O-antigen/teichoic acid export membrane protein